LSKQLNSWQTLAPHIWSQYQRPYFLSQNRVQQQFTPEIRQQRLSAMLKGFSFYHLAVLLKQDKLQLTQNLYPYIKNGTILLYDPEPAFNQLPRTFEQLLDVPGLSKNIPPCSEKGDSGGGSVPGQTHLNSGCLTYQGFQQTTSINTKWLKPIRCRHFKNKMRLPWGQFPKCKNHWLNRDSREMESSEGELLLRYLQ